MKLSNSFSHLSFFVSDLRAELVVSHLPPSRILWLSYLCSACWFRLRSINCSGWRESGSLRCVFALSLDNGLCFGKLLSFLKNSAWLAGMPRVNSDMIDWLCSRYVGLWDF